MMCKNEICKQILTVIQKIEKSGNLEIDFTQDISKDLDSIAFVTMVVELENMFDIEFDDSDFEMEKMGSINQIADIIMTYTKES